jgi:DNA replication protein DnaC
MTSDPYHEKLEHLLTCGAPELEAEFVAKGVPDTDLSGAVRDYCAGPLTFCLILGGAGAGKTIVATEALLNSKMHWNDGKSWAYSPREARFILATDLARLSYFDLASQKALGRAERCRWLVLDDVGGELVTDTWKSNFTDLILHRNSARLKTIITSNFDIDDFKARYDNRIVSRIRGNGVVILAGNVDLRRAPPPETRTH